MNESLSLSLCLCLCLCVSVCLCTRMCTYARTSFALTIQRNKTVTIFFDELAGRLRRTVGVSGQRTLLPVRPRVFRCGVCIGPVSRRLHRGVQLRSMDQSKFIASADLQSQASERQAWRKTKQNEAASPMLRVPTSFVVLT